MPLSIDLARTAPRDVEAVGVPVATEGVVPRVLGMPRGRLAELGFEGKAGQTLVIPSADGPTLIAVGIGGRRERNAAALRNAAAALVRAAGKRTSIATSLADVEGAGRGGAQAVVEGLVLASYRFNAHKSDPPKGGLARVVLTVSAAHEANVRAGV